MSQNYLFNFNSDISGIPIPDDLNNPFNSRVSEIAKLASKEFQEFIYLESKNWEHDFDSKTGKMFGVLVVQKDDLSFGYLGTVSGKLPGNNHCSKFIPSVFNPSTDNFFINRGMTELTEIGEVINNTSDKKEIALLKEERRMKSVALQKRLFENYRFTNLSGKNKNLLEIFKESINNYPPAAAGECAAPKLLQYALSNNLKPISIAEFWWGHSKRYTNRKHKSFYPACRDKCRPILEYILENTELFIEQDTSNP